MSESKKVSEYTKIAEAFTIFAKYDNGGFSPMSAVHDVIHTSEVYENMSDEDIARLETLNWWWNDDLECWSLFV